MWCSGGKDPRFDASIGGKPFHQDAFAKRYKFLFDDVLPQERSDLKKQMKVGSGQAGDQQGQPPASSAVWGLGAAWAPVSAPFGR